MKIVLKQKWKKGFKKKELLKSGSSIYFHNSPNSWKFFIVSNTYYKTDLLMLYISQSENPVYPDFPQSTSYKLYSPKR